jgi:hypothetical protein
LDEARRYLADASNPTIRLPYWIDPQMGDR